MGPLEKYKQKVKTEGFKHDPAQLQAAQLTQNLYENIINTVKQNKSWWQKLLKKPLTPITGLYFWGGVGRGKTFIMDLFYDELPINEKCRIHFHRFMINIHEQLRDLPKTPNPLPIVANRIASKNRVLCIDEFHVHDIADAMLLSGLFQALFDNGVTLVATSNIAIQELYKNGLQRDLFLPTINLIQKNTNEFELLSSEDYRFSYLETTTTYHVGSRHEDIMQQHFTSLAPCNRKNNTFININHRQILAKSVADDVIWFDFESLCERPLAALDYIELAQLFHTILLSDIPELTEDKDDAAKRFIHFIDAVYDHKVKIIASAEIKAAKLYSGRRLAFAFERTVSRLAEMGTNKYLSLAHEI